MYTTYLILGSNLGDRQKHLSDATDLIRHRLGVIQALSSIYQTASWGIEDQPDFINQVIRLSTELTPDRLLKGILKIELDMGRERMQKWGSRTIDIDILLFENRVINTPELKVPHPLLHERRFCLQPLSELAPDYIHPVFNRSITLLLDDLSDSLLVKKLS